MITSDLTAPRRFVVLGAIALAVIALTGCGSSSKSGATKTAANTTSEPATTTTAPAANAAADERIAREAKLKLADFPSGWEQKDSSEESGLEAKCEGVEAAKAATSARETSPDFEHSSDTASGSIYMYADVPGARQAFSQLSSQSTRTCIVEALAKALAAQKNEQGVTVGKITSGQVSMTPIGDERATGRVTIPITAKGFNFDYDADLVFVRTGRAIAVFTLASVLTSFDESLRDQLTKKVVGRLDAALKQQPA